jgi:hypothetical protein
MGGTRAQGIAEIGSAGVGLCWGSPQRRHRFHAFRSRQFVVVVSMQGKKKSRPKPG